MDDSKNKNLQKVPEDTGTQPTSEEAAPSAAPAETVTENNHPVPAVGSDRTAIAEAAPAVEALQFI